MISLFELFKIGIGPSSSHTLGPMLATRQFVLELQQLVARPHSPDSASPDSASPDSPRLGVARSTATDLKTLGLARVQVELFGSLALTGLGHATDRAVVMGLLGEHPETVDPATIEPRFQQLAAGGPMLLGGQTWIEFQPQRDLLLHYNQFLPRHPNALRCTAWNEHGDVLLVKQYYSVGGGFVIDDDGPLSGSPQAGGTSQRTEISQPTEISSPAADTGPPLPFTSADELLSICRTQQLQMDEVVHLNELARYAESEIERRLDAIWTTMRAAIDRGCHTSGTLPGGLKIRRRAPELYEKLTSRHPEGVSPDPLERMDWVAMFALAVNEENAAGGRVVTAPTNGAAGIIPAVLAYYERFEPAATRDGIHRFLKTAGAIGMLYKRNASLSAAEMGCQGEVGVACSMAAAGLAAVMGGTPEQIENAAEIGMEHNLGLTCDPVGGLVQIPCIERNTMGAIKAINAARLAVLYGDGSHRVSLDRVIETMRQTGVDMQSKYKETSLGGLAVNVISC
jgi:L-serine dehydratase